MTIKILQSEIYFQALERFEKTLDEYLQQNYTIKSSVISKDNILIIILFNKE